MVSPSLIDVAGCVGVEAVTDCADDTAARRIAMTLLNERPQYSAVAVWERSRGVDLQALISPQRSGRGSFAAASRDA